jgi:prepilin peptidase CpaA
MLASSSKIEVVESASSFEPVTQAIYLAGLWPFPALMTYAALRDLLSFTIPNWIPVLVICGFFLVVVTKGSLWSLATLLHSGTGIAVLAAVALLFFRGLIGGGDAKLIAAASVWMEWPQLTLFLLIMAFFGGVLALV